MTIHRRDAENAEYFVIKPFNRKDAKSAKKHYCNNTVTER